jgi:hypothetical protein
MGFGWATGYIEALRVGKEITITAPRGKSMEPMISRGDQVTLVPIARELKVDDIVLVQIRGRALLHMTKAVKGKTYLIGNNKGDTNGWVGSNSVYGVVTSIKRR